MTTATQAAGVLSFEQADETVRRYCRNLPHPQSESVGLIASLGRVLAEEVKADRDFPPFARSTRDGYAVRAADVAKVPPKLRVVGQIKAGGTFAGSVQAGQAVEIMTGAAVPEGADAVVMVEYSSGAGDQVEIQRAVSAGENVVPAG
ncbi:MAG TPA: molybdopterin molybdenumtransferase MoeA, partial [Verrucomicrobiae bacterium]|nr:molybdopterin molybdenumtransferase MoeA [Verrucomicrobiae bacterium]